MMQSPIVKDIVFSDLDSAFTQSPINDDVVTLKNFESIKRSIRNIINTNIGERPLNPDFGSNVRALLFEPFSDLLQFAIEQDIRNSLINFEPRIQVTDVRIDDQDGTDMDTLDVTIEFTPINSQQNVTVSVVLERVR